MTINPKDIQAIVSQHDRDMVGRRREWQRFEDAYGTDFWKSYRPLEGVESKESDEDWPIKVQVNHVRTWVFSFIDSLFHKGLRTLTRLSPLDAEEAKKRKVSDRAGQAISAILDQWLESDDIEELAEHAFLMGLIYPEVGWKISVDTSGEVEDVLSAISVEVIPPWELIYDRKAKSIRSMRYIGHVCPVSVEEVLRNEAWNVKEDKLRPVVREDADGGLKTPSDQPDPNSRFVRVVEFYDLTGTHKAGEGEEEVETRGRCAVYILDMEGDPFEHPVYEGAMPYDAVEGRPAPPILPMVLVPKPSAPLEGVSAVDAVYELNHEVNVAHTILANRAYRDAGDVWAYDKNKLDEKGLETLTSGRPGGMIGIEGPVTEGVVRQIQPTTISQALTQYVQQVEAARQQTAGTSPLSRGEALKYASAAEIHSLNDYTETTLGRIRKRGDRTIIRLLKLLLRVLQASMDEAKQKSVAVLVGDEMVEVERDWLDLRWSVGLSDRAATPIAEAQRRTEFAQVKPILDDLWARATQGDVMAEVMLTYAIELFDLPDDFSWQTLQGRMKEAPQPEEAQALPAEGLPPGAPAPAAAPAPPADPTAAIAEALQASAGGEA